MGYLKDQKIKAIVRSLNKVEIPKYWNSKLKEKDDLGKKLPILLFANNLIKDIKKFTPLKPNNFSSEYAKGMEKFIDMGVIYWDGEMGEPVNTSLAHYTRGLIENVRRALEEKSDLKNIHVQFCDNTLFYQTLVKQLQKTYSDDFSHPIYALSDTVSMKYAIHNETYQKTWKDSYNGLINAARYDLDSSLTKTVRYLTEKISESELIKEEPFKEYDNIDYKLYSDEESKADNVVIEPELKFAQDTNEDHDLPVKNEVLSLLDTVFEDWDNNTTVKSFKDNLWLEGQWSKTLKYDHSLYSSLEQDFWDALKLDEETQLTIEPHISFEYPDNAKTKIVVGAALQDIGDDALQILSRRLNNAITTAEQKNAQHNLDVCNERLKGFRQYMRTNNLVQSNIIGQYDAIGLGFPDSLKPIVELFDIKFQEQLRTYNPDLNLISSGHDDYDLVYPIDDIFMSDWATVQDIKNLAYTTGRRIENALNEENLKIVRYAVKDSDIYSVRIEKRYITPEMEETWKDKIGLQSNKFDMNVYIKERMERVMDKEKSWIKSSVHDSTDVFKI